MAKAKTVARTTQNVMGKPVKMKPIVLFSKQLTLVRNDRDTASEYRFEIPGRALLMACFAGNLNRTIPGLESFYPRTPYGRSGERKARLTIEFLD